MCLLMAITAVIGASVAIWGSVLGCKVTCCQGPTTAVCLINVLFVAYCGAFSQQVHCNKIPNYHIVYV